MAIHKGAGLNSHHPVLVCTLLSVVTFDLIHGIVAGVF